MEREREREGLRTVWCILGEEWAQKAALGCIPDSGIVELVDEGRNAEHVRE